MYDETTWVSVSKEKAYGRYVFNSGWFVSSTLPKYVHSVFDSDGTTLKHYLVSRRNPKEAGAMRERHDQSQKIGMG
jgi:hypothetical protein